MATQLAQIAAEAGVSVPTVSKVLNARADVSPTTRERVTAVLEQHGLAIRPRPRATTGLLDARIVNLDGAWAETVVRGAAAAARRHDKDLVLTVDPDPDDCDGWVRRALARGTDGLVSFVAVPSEDARRGLADSGVPLVVVDPLHRVPDGTMSISATNFQGAFDATNHLLALGHRRIATVTGPFDQDNAIARFAGFQAAMLQSGQPVDPGLVDRSGYGIPHGYDAMRALLDEADPPTAIFAASDDSALGAIRAIRERGLHVPDDISVIGFDDLPFSQWTDPPLTTIRQPLAEMGDAAVELLIRIRAGLAPTAHTELSTRLIVRSSTARLG
ncbi:LacI family DNA-binding transcriptional regulator [Agromyces cerinus]|uniref:Transcriptional regulator, LacI family n=1 Tax=Agromyces cerinus subsp. cerinus TaxID=232089 RepID=A0A1N6FZU7_9MICO|nr:LacI family DNA-binding transcriptional regulator [Agromyces cerinus]SIO00798.1 transcriptional regulator, LacI family [Agromyces cerinus subsp. cerinus]